MYEPGPYSLMEDYLRRFVEWYLHTISQEQGQVGIHNQEGQAA